MTTPIWPAPPPRRGAKIRHGWRCARTATVVETVTRDATGRAWVVDQCQGCDGTDLAERLLTQGGDDDGPVAA